jgi:hypothetical protein
MTFGKFAASMCIAWLMGIVSALGMRISLGRLRR